jgi:hypothetical protein
MARKMASSTVVALLVLVASFARAQEKDKEPIRLSIDPPHISSDKSIQYDYDIIYVRGLRRSDGKEARWAEFSRPTMMEPGADLMLLHPDGAEEVLVSGAEPAPLRGRAIIAPRKRAARRSVTASSTLARAQFRAVR